MIMYEHTGVMKGLFYVVYKNEIWQVTEKHPMKIISITNGDGDTKMLHTDEVLWIGRGI